MAATIEENQKEVRVILKFIKSAKEPVSVNQVSIYTGISWTAAKRIVTVLLRKKLISESDILLKQVIFNVKPKHKISLDTFLSSRDKKLEFV